MPNPLIEPKLVPIADALAWALTVFHIARGYCPPNQPASQHDRTALREDIVKLEAATAEVRRLMTDAKLSLVSLPPMWAIELRVCEKAIPHLKLRLAAAGGSPT